MSPRQYPAKKGTSADKMAHLPHFADGGFIGGMRARMFGPAETVTQKYARQDAERAAKAPAPAAVPAAAPAPSPAAGLGMISNYAGMTAMQRREKEAGMKDGGAVTGPGTGTSDSVPIMASHGEYMLPADTTKALGGKKVLDKIVDATHTPTGKPAIKRGMMARADGGMVDPIKSNSFGDASASTSNPGTSVVSSTPMAPPAPAPVSTMASPPAMSTNAAAMGSTPAPSSGGGRPVQIVSAMEYRPMMAMPAMSDGKSVDEARKRLIEQIPTGGTPQVVGGERIDSTEAGRNVSNALSAVPGAAPTMMAARGMSAASRFAPAGAGLAGGLARAAAPVAPVIPPVAGGLALMSATSPTATAQTPAPAVAPATPATTLPSNRPVAGVPTTQTAPAEQATDPNQITVTKQANGVTSFSGGPNIGMNGGANTYVGDAAKRMGGGFGVSTVPGMSRAAIDQALGGLSASQVSSENAIRAANLRDGVDINRGTAAGQAADAQQRMQALASSPLGTPGRAFAQKQVLANASEATARRGQDITNASTQARLGMEKTSFDRAGKGIDLDNQAKEQLQNAQTAFANAKTPAEKVAAEATLRALQGRYEKEQPNRFTVVPRGTNEQGQNLGSYVLDADGRIVDPGEQQSAPKAKAQPEGALLKGKDGKDYIVKNGVPTLL